MPDRDRNGSTNSPPLADAPPAAAAPAADGIGGRARRLLDRLVAGRAPAPDPGDAVALTGAEAVRRVEDAIGSTAEADPSAAFGAALTGRRAALFVDAAGLAGARPVLAEAARAGVPLVAHVRLDGAAADDAWQALAGTGAVLLNAGDAQQAADLAVVARLVAESALAPVALALDGRETADAVAGLHLPDPGRLVALVGLPGDVVAAASAEQRLVFGERRRRVPRALDGAAPAAVGAAPAGPAAAAAAAAAGFRAEALPRLLAAACARLEAVTGRAVSLCAAPEKRGDLLVVASGASRALASAVADHLRRDGGPRVAVAGVAVLRPAPLDGLAVALGRCRRVVVLDRAGAAGEDGALLALVRAALAAGEDGPGRRPEPPQLATVALPPSGAPVAAGDIAAALRALATRWQPRLALGTGVPAGAAAERYPKRRARTDAWRAEYPRLAAEVAAEAAGPAGPAPPGSAPHGSAPRTAGDAAVVAGVAAGAAGAAVAEVAARVLHATAGGSVTTRAGADVPRLDLLAWSPAGAAAGCDGLGDDAAVDLLVATAAEAPRVLGRVRDGGAVVVAGRMPVSGADGRVAPPASFELPAGEAPAARVDRLAGGLLAALRRSGALAVTVRRLVSARRDQLAELPAAAREERLAAFAAGLAEPAAGAAAEAPGLPASRGSAAAAAGATSGAAGSAGAGAGAGSGWPAALGSPDPALVALWDQAAVLYRDGAPRLAPDPLLAAPLPAGSAALRGPAAGGDGLPALDAAACTGCGVCWTTCPEGAWSAVPVPPRALLEHGLGLARDAGDNAEALRPLLGRLADALAAASAEGGGAAGPLLDRAFAALAAAGLPAGREEATREGFAALRRALAPLPLARTAAFWDRAPGGKPALLALALDGDRCTGCGLCVAECTPAALAAGDAATAARAAAGAAVAAGLPAPPSALVAAAAADPEVGPLAAALLQPAARAALAGSGEAADAGARLALRLALGAAVGALLPRREGLAADAAGVRDALHGAVRQRLADALPAADLGAFRTALARADRPDAGLTALLGDLHDGSGALVGVPELRRLVAAADSLGEVVAALERPAPAGLLTLVLAPGLASSLGFPWNPFAVPVACPPGADPVAVARGVAAAAALEATAAAAALRHARLVLERPGEAARPAPPLAWGDLEPGERALCPPVLLALDEATARARLGVLVELLVGELPVAVVVLEPTADGAAGEAGAADLVTLLGAVPGAWLGQSSPAAPAHLAAALGDAVAAAGPALVRVHAPEPAAAGEGVARLLAQAREALAAGWPLVTRAPGAAPAAVVASAAAAAAAAAAAEREAELATRMAALESERDALAAQLAAAPLQLREALRVELAREAKGRLLTLLAGSRGSGEGAVQ